ncbi:F-box domain [Dillenia turbinata]|uniref:F-box domain n=1 Tax=Dillenia turbinata TaxID=194707 RepID=A0AAN8ZIK8_9MAGN
MDSKLLTTRNWSYMVKDILVKAFLYLDIVDLVVGASRVCRSWNLAAQDPYLWRTVDLSLLNPARLANLRMWVDMPFPEMCVRIMKGALCLSCNGVTCLIFKYGMCLSDHHFIYAAERSPNLKRLVLPYWNQLTESGFSHAVQKWERLESMTIEFVCNPPSAFEALGAHCKNLSSIKILYPFDWGYASAMCAFLPKLKVVSLQSSMVTKDALVLILDQLEHLEVLNLSHCLFVGDRVDNDGGSVYNRLDAQLNANHDASVLEKASRLRVFLTCQEKGCPACPDTSTGLGFSKWFSRAEDIWRIDQISSLAH